jgi:hypothetical protein
VWGVDDEERKVSDEKRDTPSQRGNKATSLKVTKLCIVPFREIVSIALRSARGDRLPATHFLQF